MRRKIVFIVGPTATGKTEISLALAKKINAEIISCDSMQVYRGMDILTAKPSASLRKIIPHHLLGILCAEKEYNASKYYRDASRQIRKIQGKGKVPLVVGGTGLYMSILIDGIFKVKAKLKDEAERARKKLLRQAEEHGSKWLYRRLLKIDREAAAKIHPHDARRIIRALEVFVATGQPISQLQKQRRGLSQDYQIKIFGLDMERDKLYQRIDRRVEKMFARGLVSEVKRLLKMKLSLTARYALGIREIKGYLDGAYGLEGAKQLLKKNTRNYAKRQITWFRKDKRINWIKVSDKEKPLSVANRIFKKI